VVRRLRAGQVEAPAMGAKENEGPQIREGLTFAPCTIPDASNVLGFY